jgi:hypothetical protein
MEDGTCAMAGAIRREMSNPARFIKAPWDALCPDPSMRKTIRPPPSTSALKEQ